MFESKGLEYHKGRRYGLYRGYVYDNKDPKGMGRLRVCCPSALGIDDETEEPIVSEWAYPKFPIAGNGWGINTIPPLTNEDGTNVMVWVEFEMGDINYPVWSGCPVANNSLQEDVKTNQSKINKGKSADCVFCFTSPKGRKIILDDTDGVLTVSDGKKTIVMDKDKVNVKDEYNNSITMDKQGLKFIDGNSNSITTSSSGIRLSDGKGNSISTSSGGVTISTANKTTSF